MDDKAKTRTSDAPRDWVRRARADEHVDLRELATIADRIADELDAWCDGADVDGDACDVPRGIAERIRKMAAKEGE